MEYSIPEFLQNQIDEMKRRNYQRKNFVNQSTRLVTRFPEHKDEILDYVSQLNTKWDRLAQTVTPKNTMSVDCFSRRKGKLNRRRFGFDDKCTNLSFYAYIY